MLTDLQETFAQELERIRKPIIKAGEQSVICPYCGRAASVLDFHCSYPDKSKKTIRVIVEIACTCNYHTFWDDMAWEQYLALSLYRAYNMEEEDARARIRAAERAARNGAGNHRPENFASLRRSSRLLRLPEVDVEGNSCNVW